MEPDEGDTAGGQKQWAMEALYETVRKMDMGFNLDDIVEESMEIIPSDVNEEGMGTTPTKANEEGMNVTLVGASANEERSAAQDSTTGFAWNPPDPPLVNNQELTGGFGLETPPVNYDQSALGFERPNEPQPESARNEPQPQSTQNLSEPQLPTTPFCCENVQLQKTFNDLCNQTADREGVNLLFNFINLYPLAGQCANPIRESRLPHRCRRCQDEEFPLVHETRYTGRRRVRRLHARLV